MEWFFFVLLNAAFFVRPGDLMQSADFPVYNFTMIACLILAGPRVVEVARSWRQSPITTCVLGMVAACLLSHMSRAYFGRAVEDGIYLVKIIIYYLVFVAIVNSPARLQSFLRWFVVFTLVLTGLALAHWHELVSIECLAACQQYEFNSVTGQIEVIPRLRSTGVFNDPNDLSMVLIVGVIICLYIIDNAQSGIGTVPLAGADCDFPVRPEAHILARRTAQFCDQPHGGVLVQAGLEENDAGFGRAASGHAHPFRGQDDEAGHRRHGRHISTPDPDLVPWVVALPRESSLWCRHERIQRAPESSPTIVLCTRMPNWGFSAGRCLWAPFTPAT